MIDAKDLRIGNWVMYELTKHYITAIEGDYCKSRWYKQEESESDYEHFLSECEPIPLTPEILENCGFEKGISEWYNKKYFTDCQESAEVMEIQLNAKSFRCGIADTDFGGTNAMTSKRVEHLHDLQNLYYALTKQELNYQL